MKLQGRALSNELATARIKARRKGTPLFRASFPPARWLPSQRSAGARKRKTYIMENGWFRAVYALCISISPLHLPFIASCSIGAILSGARLASGGESDVRRSASAPEPNSLQRKLQRTASTRAPR